MGKLDGKVAVITGSGRGIGKATAEIFAKEGASVVINDLDESVALAVVKEIKDAGGKAVACIADVTKPADTQKLMDTAVEKFGKLDILINCAGITRDAPIHKMTDDQWNLVLDISLKGTFNCIRSAAKYMRKEGHNGRIVNIASMAALRGGATQGNYAAAKGGIISLTKVIAHEWESFGINCNCVAYGPVDTRLTRDRDAQQEAVGGEKLGVPQKAREALLARYGGKIMSTEDAVVPILFLVSPETWFINGNVIQAALNGFM